MRKPPPNVTVKAILVSRTKAAAMLGMSVDSFDRFVMPHVRCVRRRSLRLYPVAELERWADENAAPLFREDE